MMDVTFKIRLHKHPGFHLRGPLSLRPTERSTWQRTWAGQHWWAGFEVDAETPTTVCEAESRPPVPGQSRDDRITGQQPDLALMHDLPPEALPQRRPRFQTNNNIEQLFILSPYVLL